MQDDAEFFKMVSDYMSNGMLENIISMFRQDASYYRMIPDLIADERVRVRLGTTALVEDLAREKPDSFKEIVPEIGRLLESENLTLRGDAANLLAIISLPECRPYFERYKNDENADIRSIMLEAITEMDGRN
ncbi:MAG: hypothetical protein OEZ34_00275 [Spirochaetia bacterium]|nr:hypothetical protein [Spirochaetia bacterium]